MICSLAIVIVVVAVVVIADIADHHYQPNDQKPNNVDLKFDLHDNALIAVAVANQ